MIRYTCHSCDKSLRANDDIIGCKAQCTRCGTIARVPATSTRSSNQQKKQTNAESVPAQVESEAPHDPHVDVAGDEQSSTKLSVALPTQLSNPKVPTDPVEPTNEAVDEFEPVFKRIEQKSKFVSPMTLAFAAGLLVISVCGFWYVYFGQSKLEKTTTKFAQTAEVIQYQAAMSDLRKSQRILSLMADGYLAAKNLPESELGDLNEFVRSLDQLTTENIAIEEAKDLFDSGHRDTATELIKQELEILADFQTEIRERTLELQSKTYQ